jgi:hypothetical protein
MLPVWSGNSHTNAAIIYAERDVPEITLYCQDLKKQGLCVQQVGDTTHADIYLAQRTLEIVDKMIGKWLDI